MITISAYIDMLMGNLMVTTAFQALELGGGGNLMSACVVMSISFATIWYNVITQGQSVQFGVGNIARGKPSVI